MMRSLEKKKRCKVTVGSSPPQIAKDFLHEAPEEPGKEGFAAFTPAGKML